MMMMMAIMMIKRADDDDDKVCGPHMGCRGGLSHSNPWLELRSWPVLCKRDQLHLLVLISHPEEISLGGPSLLQGGC